MNPAQQYFQQALGLYQRGQLEQALPYAEQAYKASSKLPQIINLYGALLGETGDYTTAQKVFEKAIKKFKKDPELHSNFGLLLKKNGDHQQACIMFERALRINPNFLIAKLHLANTLKLMHQLPDAIKTFKQYLAKQPEHVEALASLADTYESQSELELAEQAVDKALALNPDHGLANLVKAQLEIRHAKDLDAAIERLQSLLKQSSLTLVNRTIVHSRLAKCYNDLENYPLANEHYQKANNTIRPRFSAIENLQGPPYGTDYVKSLNHWLEQTDAEQLRAHFQKLAHNEQEHKAESDTVSTPIFMLGFPRSGTTLLDRMLSMDPGLQSIEEQETLFNIQQDAFASDNPMQFLLQLTDEQRKHYRKAYWARINKLIKFDSSKTLVDKLPLNSIHLPFILSLFPNAKIIVTLRDPRAVILSCFMQRFGVNQAMSHFLSLEDAANYYQQVMGFATDFLDATQISVHEHHYEDLVTTPEATLKQLMRYLDRDYLPEMLEFHQSAKGASINTPSYEQVAKPLYTEATERWRHYQDHLEPNLVKIQPFIERFGY